MSVFLSGFEMGVEVKNEEGRRWIKYRQDNCRNDCDRLGESIFHSVKLQRKYEGQNPKRVCVRSCFACKEFHICDLIVTSAVQRALAVEASHSPPVSFRFVSFRQHRRGRASMEGRVPPLVLLHDAVEEPVRPLQQTGALH